MVFMLALADACIPAAAIDIPGKLKDLLKPDKLSQVLCAGNCNRSTIEYLKRISSDIAQVRGDSDDYSLPESKVIEVEGVKIGLCHGHCVVPAGDEAALLALQRKLGVDVLVTGGSHQVKVTKRNGALLLDPGSVTGADKGFQSGFNPSYVVMDVHAGKVSLWTYTLKKAEEDGEVRFDLDVDTEEYTTPLSGNTGSVPSEGSQHRTAAATSAASEEGNNTSMPSPAATDLEDVPIA